MNALSFMGMALRSIQHGGQRMVVAVLCIMFGVMSLISMSALADSMSSTILSDPRVRLGGDMELSPNSVGHITPEHLAMFEAMRQSGEISAFMPLSANYSITLRTLESGELHFIQQGLGIDPQLYPLVGTLEVEEPSGAQAADLLREAGDILLTRDLATSLAVTIGDTVIVGDLSSSLTVEATVRGIIAATPDRMGSKVLYDLATAQVLAGSEAYLDKIVLTAPDPDAVEAELEANGWWAFPLEAFADSTREVQDMWDLALKGAGILGLLVGGIGIANTMQVLLARRTREIAIFKTLGYSQRDMLSLFMLEAAILGGSGSVLGAGAGVLVSRWLVTLLGRTTSFLIEWSVEPVTVLMSMLVGFATTLIFTTAAIVRTSAVRPSALLRNERVQPTAFGWVKLLGLWAALAIPFTLITTLILESPIKGIGMVLFALGGLVLLGGAFAGLMLFGTRLIPAARLPFLGISLSSLRRRGLSLIFAMIALFVGTVTLTLAAVITQSGQRELGERTFNVEGYDVTILAPASKRDEVRAAVSAYSAAETYDLEVRRVSAPDVHEGSIIPVLSGQGVLTDMAITDGPAWDDQAGGVYVYYTLDVPLGSEVEVEMLDGSLVTLPIVGYYSIDFAAPGWSGHFGLLMHPDTLLSIAEPDRVTFHLDVPDAQRAAITADLGKALPDAIVINVFAYLNRFGQNYRNLFVLGLSLAGLALLAGVLLIANAVSLAMINRRYEIGVLKAVGYTRWHILSMLAVEYSLIGVIAAIAGVIAAVLTVVVVGALNDTAGSLLTLDWSTALMMLLVTIALTLFAVLITAWKPTQIAPVVVLVDRE